MVDKQIQDLVADTTPASGDTVETQKVGGGAGSSKQVTIDDVITQAAPVATGSVKGVMSAADKTLVDSSLFFSKVDATVAPAVTDDSNSSYEVGSVWIDVTADKAYVCLDASVGAAVWTETTQTGGGGGAFQYVAVLEKTALYTILSADAGKLLTASGTFTLTLPTSLTNVGQDFIDIINIGTGSITVSAGTDGINVLGNDTLVLGPGELARLTYAAAADPKWRSRTADYSLLSSGAGAPASTPSKVGEIYVDTTNDVAYISAGTASSADWKQSSGEAVTGTSAQMIVYDVSGDIQSVTITGDISVSNTGVVTVVDANIDHGSIGGLADDDHSQYSLISSGAGAPGSTPSRVGEVYIDTTADEAYHSAGTASSADWKKSTNVAGGAFQYGSVLAKTAIYTILSADAGKLLTADGTFTLTLPTSFTNVGQDFIDIINIGTGSITVSAGVDGINQAGNDTIILGPSESTRLTYAAAGDPKWRANERLDANIDHGSIGGLADDDHTQYSLISSGAGVPVSTPSRVGLIYVDTDAEGTYHSVGTTSSADWAPDISFKMGTGILSGGVLSINVDTTRFDISDGTGVVIDNADPANPVYTPVTWTGLTAQTVTNIVTTESTNIAINSSGAVIQQEAAFSEQQHRELIKLGGISHIDNVNVDSAFTFKVPAYDANVSVFSLSQALGLINLSGNVFSANGVNLNINRTSGTVFAFGQNTDSNTQDPHTTAQSVATAANFLRMHSDGAGGEVVTGSFATIDPENYDVSGTLTTMPNNQYQIKRLWVYSNTGLNVVQYGTATYGNIEAAISGINTETFPQLPALSTALLRGWLVVKKGTTDLTNVAEASFIEADKFSTNVAGGTVGIGSVVEDTTPQLGGDLDVNGQSIVSVSAGDIAITPDTTGNVVLDGLNWPQADGTVNQIIETDGAGQLAFTNTLVSKAIDANTNTITNIGFAEFDTDFSSTTDFFIGSSLDTPAITVTSNGTTILLNLEKAGTGDVRYVFTDGVHVHDCTPIDTVVLTAGSDISPQINFVYILQSTKALTASTAGFPATEYAPVATVFCQSALSLQSFGAYKVHAWVDHTINAEVGHLSHLNHWVRHQPATWQSGAALTPTVGLNTFDLATSSGEVLQLHDHAYPAFDTSTGSDIYIVNDNTTAFDRLGDLTTVTTDAAGAALDVYYNLVIWGVVSENTSDCKLMCNVPLGSYNNNNASKATIDVDNTAIYTISSDFTGTGFLIARLTVSVSGSTFTIEQNEDLRGFFPGTVAGGGAIGGNEFSDNVFRVQDEGDVTKQLAFQLANVTTGNTRTLSVPDASGTIILDVSQATETAAGVAELSTQAEAEAWANDITMMTPLKTSQAINVLFSSGAGAPSSTPSFVGETYIDTTADVSYISVGTVSSADWDRVSDLPGTSAEIVVYDGSNDAQSVAMSGDVTIDNTGATIVDGTVVSKVFTSYTALKAADVTDMDNGDVVYVSGRTTVGDGGEGHWRVLTSTPGTADDGTILDSDTASWFFERLFVGGAKVAWWGATGSADDTTGIQNALNAYNHVLLGATTYTCTQLTINTEQVLEGAGHRSTFIKLKDTTNTHLLQSVDFATLTGLNKWFAGTEGVPQGIELRNFSIDGNKANNLTTGDGIRFYSKRTIIENVVIFDCRGNGLYTECANKGGQNDVRDMPESIYGPLWIHECEGHGMHYKGPHDGTIPFLAVSGGGGLTNRGLLLESDGSTFNGSCEIGSVHLYACTVGFESIQGRFKVNGKLEVESSRDQGVIIAGGGHSINAIYAFNNGLTTSSVPAVQLDCTEFNVGMINARAGSNTTILKTTGNSGVISNLMLDGDETVGVTGWVNEANQITGMGTIIDCDTGLDQDLTGGNKQCYFALTFSEINNDLVDISQAGGQRNIYNLSCFNATTIEVFDTATGNAPHADDVVNALVIANSVDLSFTQGPTYTGDFTVDDPTFHVDSTNGRVGVGTTSPSFDLHLKVASGAADFVASASGKTGVIFSQQAGGTGVFGVIDNNNLSLRTNNLERSFVGAGGEHNFIDNIVQRPNIKDYSVESTAATDGATVTLDLAADGNDQTLTLSQNITLAFSNWPPTGTLGKVTFQCTQDSDTAKTVSVAANVDKWPEGTAWVMSTGLSAIDEVVFWSRDAGTTVYGAVIGQAFA